MRKFLLPILSAVALCLTAGGQYNPPPGGGTVITNGTTATTQPSYDSSTLIATDAFARNSIARARGTTPVSVTGGTYNLQSAGGGATFDYTAVAGAITAIGTISNGGSGYLVGDVITVPSGNYDALLAVSTVSSTAVTGLAILYGGTAYTTGTSLPARLPQLSSSAILLSGTITSNVIILLPQGSYLTTGRQFGVANNTTGAFTVKVMMSNGAGAGIGTGVFIPPGTSNSILMWLESDGLTDVWIMTGSPVNSISGAPSVSPMLFNGVIQTGGTGTTNFPHIMIQPSTATAETAWSTNGTVIGVNTANGYTGFFLDFHKNNGVSVFNVDNAGVVTGGSFTGGGFTSTGITKSTFYTSTTNCLVNSVSPAACGASIAGAFVVPTTTTTYTVNTTGLSANSEIFITPRTYVGSLPSSPTCVAPLLTTVPVVSAIVSGTSFTITLTSTTGQTCWAYHIMN